MTLNPQLEVSRMQCQITTHFINNSMPTNPVPSKPCLSGLRAGDEDLTSADKASTKILVACALFLAIWLFSDLDKVDEFLDGTALQRVLAIYFVFITLSLCAFVIFNTMVLAYYLPLGSRTLRIIIWFLCLCGTLTLAFYYGDTIST